MNKFHITNISNKIKIKMTNLNKNSKKAFSLVEISIVILIIGLLIAGISKASDLIFDANIASGRSITKSAKVNRMPNLVLWLETTLAESIKDSERGGTVTIWRDINPQSTTKFIFRNSGGTPQYVEPGKNLPAIGSLSASNYFTVGTEASTTVLSQKVNDIFTSANATIFMVLKSPTTSSVDADLFSFCPNAGCAVGTQISISLASGKPTFIFPSGTGASATATTTNNYFGTVPNVIIVSALKDSAGNKIAVNGASAVATSANTNTQLPVAFDTATFKIGGVGTATGVEIYEIIVFSSALNEGDRQSVESYLAKKYNTTVVKATL